MANTKQNHEEVVLAVLRREPRGMAAPAVVEALNAQAYTRAQAQDAIRRALNSGAIGLGDGLKLRAMGETA